MREDADDGIGPAPVEPEEDLADLATNPRRIGPAIDRLAPQLQLLRPRRVPIDRVGRRIAPCATPAVAGSWPSRPDPCRRPELGAVPGCPPGGSSSSQHSSGHQPTRKTRPINRGSDRLQIASYDYKYRRHCRLVNGGRYRARSSIGGIYPVAEHTVAVLGVLSGASCSMNGAEKISWPLCRTPRFKSVNRPTASCQTGSPPDVEGAPADDQDCLRVGPGRR